MANELKTEIIVRDHLRDLGYFDDNTIIVEEQKVIAKQFQRYYLQRVSQV